MNNLYETLRESLTRLSTPQYLAQLLIIALVVLSLIHI